MHAHLKASIKIYNYTKGVRTLTGLRNYYSGVCVCVRENGLEYSLWVLKMVGELGG